MSILEKERKNGFELKRVQRSRYRTRYFTDPGIIGTKEFVSGVGVDSKISLCPKGIRDLSRLRVWMGFIL